MSRSYGPNVVPDTKAHTVRCGEQEFVYSCSACADQNHACCDLWDASQRAQSPFDVELVRLQLQSACPGFKANLFSSDAPGTGNLCERTFNLCGGPGGGDWCNNQVAKCLE